MAVMASLLHPLHVYSNLHDYQRDESNVMILKKKSKNTREKIKPIRVVGK